MLGWNFPQLLATFLTHPKNGQKKHPPIENRFLHFYIIKKRQQFHTMQQQHAKQQGHFNNLAAISPTKPVSPAPSSTTPAAAAAAQRCHSDGGSPSALADTRRPDKFRIFTLELKNASYWGLSNENSTILIHFINHIPQYPPRNLWNLKIVLNFECCEA